MTTDRALLLMLLTKMEAVYRDQSSLLGLILGKLYDLPADEVGTIVDDRNRQCSEYFRNAFLSVVKDFDAAFPDNGPELSGLTPEQLVELLSRRKPGQQDE